MTSRYPDADDDDLLQSLDRQTNAQSPPLDRLSSHSPLPSLPQQQHPYLIALLTCPDMGAYLAKTELPEDVWPLPLATLLSEAQAEESGDALQRLEWLRDYVWEAAAHDVGAMGSVLDALFKNEDQLENVLCNQKKQTNIHQSCVGEG